MMVALLGVPAGAADKLSPDIKSSQKFKTKRAGDTSSLVSQDELDAQALEDELDGKLKPQNITPSISDPASGATWTPGVSPAAGTTGDTAVISEDAETATSTSPIAYGADPALQQQQTEDPMVKFITDLFGGTMGTGNPGSNYDYGTEATYTGPGCIDCANSNSGFDLPKIDTSQIPGWVSLDNDSRLSESEKCYSLLLLNGAKVHVAEEWNNREKSLGKCARGVRGSLDEANMNDGVGLGDAIQFQSDKRLEQLGFRNVMDASMDPNNAPVGSVLVFSGPRTDEFLRNPGAYGRDEINGSLVGHVTIKGDDGYFYTDGRTAEPAVANRKLVGVFVMSKCTKCPESMKNQCAARPTVQ